MLDAPAPVLPKKTRGLRCPRCSCTFLPVIRTGLPCAGIRIRYRVCMGCGCRIVTKEQILRWSYPLPKDAKATVAKLKKVYRQRDNSV